nr:protein YgfX [Thiocapsa imhoffii]
MTFTHLLACVALVVMGWRWFTLPLVLAVLLSALHVGFVAVLRRAPWSICAALCQADGTWQLQLVSGAEHEAILLPSTFVSLPLVVLNFKLGPWTRRSLPIFADALEPDLHRRLRQRLRLAGAARVQPAERP